MADYVIYITVLFCFNSITFAQHEDFWRERQRFLKEEQSLMVGAKLKLNEKEQIVNGVLMREKINELEFGFNNPDKFPPAIHFFEAKKYIERSKVGAF